MNPSNHEMYSQILIMCIIHACNAIFVQGYTKHVRPVSRYQTNLLKAFEIHALNIYFLYVFMYNICMHTVDHVLLIAYLRFTRSLKGDHWNIRSVTYQMLCHRVSWVTIYSATNSNTNTEMCTATRMSHTYTVSCISEYTLDARLVFQPQLTKYKQYRDFAATKSSYDKR